MDNRSKLLARALELFALQGYEAVGVQEIVDAAALTKPTLYHYFGSKQGLLQTLLDENCASLYAQVCQAAVYQGDLPLTLRKVARSYFAFSQQNALYYRLHLALWFSPSQSEPHRAVAGWNEQFHHVLEDLFTQAAGNHGNMRGRQRFYAASFAGAINTCIGLALNGYSALDEEMLERAIHQFEHGIYS